MLDAIADNHRNNICSSMINSNAIVTEERSSFRPKLGGVARWLFRAQLAIPFSVVALMVPPAGDWLFANGQWLLSTLFVAGALVAPPLVICLATASTLPLPRKLLLGLGSSLVAVVMCLLYYPMYL